MASYNRVILMGNLTRDPELKYTPSGMAVAKMGLAMNRSYKTKTGETKEDVCFVTVTCWAKQGERCAEYLKKGSPALIEGRLQSRSWTTPDGQKRNVLEVVADRVQFLRSGRGAEGAGREAPEEAPSEAAPGDAGPPEAGSGDDEVPF